MKKTTKNFIPGPEKGAQGPDRDEIKTINPDMLVPDRSGGVPGPENLNFGKTFDLFLKTLPGNRQRLSVAAAQLIMTTG